MAKREDEVDQEETSGKYSGEEEAQERRYGFVAVRSATSSEEVALDLERPRRVRSRGCQARLPSVSYPEAEASSHDSVRRAGFRVSRAPHRAAAATAVFPPVARLRLVVPRDLGTSENHPGIRGRDRAILQQRIIVHPLQHDRWRVDRDPDRTIGMERDYRFQVRHEGRYDRSSSAVRPSSA